MNFEPSAKSKDYLERVQRFVREEIAPLEEGCLRASLKQSAQGDWKQWRVLPEIEKLKAAARAQGLWNLFLPDAQLAPGLTTVEYAPIAEATGRSLIAPEIFNCNAP